MKTIKQIADETGVSKQAVRNKIAKLGLQSSLRKNANQFAIDEQQEKLIISAFSENMQTENANQSQSESQTTLQFTLRFLEQEIEFLKGQLKEKDEQLERLDRRLAEAQILHADTKNLLTAPTEPEANTSLNLFARIKKTIKRKKRGIDNE